MRKTLKQKLTGSMMLAVLASMAILSVCLLLGMTRYSSAQFLRDVSGVFTTDLLTELNSAATGSAETAASSVQQTVDAYAGQLGIGAGRDYSIWDAATGNFLGGSQENPAATDNVITAMSGVVGDAVPLLASSMDVAIPVTGDIALVVDIRDDGSAMRSLCWTLLLLLLAALALSLLMCFLLSRIMASAFAASAVQTARDIRDGAQQAVQSSGDWEAMAFALCEPVQNRDKQSGGMPELTSLLSPYLEEGLVQFTAEGTVTQMNSAAQTLLGVEFHESAAFDEVFCGVPMPDETHSMVHGRFTRAGTRLDVIFLALDGGTFAAVVRSAEGAPL